MTRRDAIPRDATSRARRGRLPLTFLLVLMLLPGAGCSDDDTVTPGLSAGFTPSSPAAAADAVRLRQVSVSGDLVVLAVAIGGPTTSQDLYSFAFDLVLGNPNVARYEAGSATFGTALVIGAGQDRSVIAAQHADRVVVGVSKLGGGSGNGVAGGEPAIVELRFRVLTAGVTEVRFGGPPAALDSTGADIGTITFDAAGATITAQ